ncbi:RELT-like protein 1 [Clupea harengus]|uniref:RELT-like protein 1 n=1 Tax=Clupea harengus TaxID=7950 RepID=A0A6P8GPG5_CLUHA|nr:RELT-like protein 1 [Clupea harengus]
MGDLGITSDVTPVNPDDISTNTDVPTKTNGPEYVAFGLVPVFFLLGLLGVLICHALKKKGYRCTTEAEDAEAEAAAEADKELEKDAERGLNDTYSEDNSDTVGQIVHYIMKNEANRDALKAMVNDNSIDSDGPPTPTSPMTPTTPETPGSPGSPGFPGAPAAAATKHTCNHLHTIGGMGGHKNICNRCSQKKWPLMRRLSARKVLDRRSNPGEVTVLAVGRFRVTKCDPKTGKERRTLLITEPNGTVSAAPAAETTPEERPPSSQAQEETNAI